MGQPAHCTALHCTVKVQIYLPWAHAIMRQLCQQEEYDMKGLGKMVVDDHDDNLDMTNIGLIVSSDTEHNGKTFNSHVKWRKHGFSFLDNCLNFLI
jgi:hypothetical protein